MMDVKDAREIIKDLLEKPFICAENFIKTESGYVITREQPQADKWIPCEERLPSETEYYYVTWRDMSTSKNYVEMIEYDSVSQEWLGCISQAGLLGYDIIAWQPLPQPYKKEGAE